MKPQQLNPNQQSQVNSKWPGALLDIISPEMRLAAMQLRGLPYENYSRCISPESIEALYNCAYMIGVDIDEFDLEAKAVPDSVDLDLEEYLWVPYMKAKRVIEKRLNEILMDDVQHFGESPVQKAHRETAKKADSEIEQLINGENQNATE